MKVAVLLVSATLIAPAVGVQAQDAEAGKKIFKKCAACHQIGEGAKNRVGPVLTGVVGRLAGTYQGYKYSKSMQALEATGFSWNEDEIFNWLANPTKYLRAKLQDPHAKSKMSFRLKKEQDRRDVIAYLATFTTPKSAEASPAPATTMPVASAPADAKGICVVNSAPKAHLFTVESASHDRKVQQLAHGEALCVDSTGPGTVAVFLSEDAIEGCTRIAQADKPEVLLHYYPFDRCLWVGNQN